MLCFLSEHREVKGQGQTPSSRSGAGTVSVSPDEGHVSREYAQWTQQGLLNSLVETCDVDLLF